MAAIENDHRGGDCHAQDAEHPEPFALGLGQGDQPEAKRHHDRLHPCHPRHETSPVPDFVHGKEQHRQQGAEVQREQDGERFGVF